MEQLTTALCVPVRGQLNETKGVHGLFNDYFMGKVYIADSLPTSESENFFRKLYGRRLKYLSMEGSFILNQLNSMWKEASEDIVIYTHNDVYLYGDWETQVKDAFANPEVGFVAAIGMRGTLAGGGRLDIMSNMLEAEVHGRRSTKEEFITHGDGFFLAFRRKALFDVGGFDDKDYVRFHGWDRNIAMQMIEAGFKGKYVPISCHHRSGVTACGNEYQNAVNEIRGISEGGDKLDHDHNMYEVFNKKWGDKLPIMVDEEGNLMEGPSQWGDFKNWHKKND